MHRRETFSGDLRLFFFRHHKSFLTISPRVADFEKRVNVAYVNMHRRIYARILCIDIVNMSLNFLLKKYRNILQLCIYYTNNRISIFFAFEMMERIASTYHYTYTFARWSPSYNEPTSTFYGPISSLIQLFMKGSIQGEIYKIYNTAIVIYESRMLPLRTCPPTRPGDMLSRTVEPARLCHPFISIQGM